jgi:Uncharacterised protein conserved in bacteria (DUF2336)
VKLPSLPNLEGLIRLAREDRVDVRPTLLRVLADMYVQKLGHPADEERRFVELASWLLTPADVETRATVARKLSRYPEAPRKIVRRLAADVFEVAEPMLRYSSCLTAEDLLEIAIECGPRHAAVIDERKASAENAASKVELSKAAPPELKTALMEPGVTSVQSKELDAAPPSNIAYNAVFEPLSNGVRFLRGDADERRSILETLAEYTPSTDAQSDVEPDREGIARLETAARAERPDDFARILQQMLRLPPRICRDIVDDDRGEPIAVAAKALGVPADVLLRIVLFLNPKVGQSVERVFALVNLYARMPSTAALQLVSDWRVRSAGRPSVYQPVHWDDERRTRRSAAEAAWRSGRQQAEAGDESRGSSPTVPERRQRTT